MNRRPMRGRMERGPRTNQKKHTGEIMQRARWIADSIEGDSALMLQGRFDSVEYIEHGVGRRHFPYHPLYCTCAIACGWASLILYNTSHDIFYLIYGEVTHRLIYDFTAPG